MNLSVSMKNITYLNRITLLEFMHDIVPNGKLTIDISILILMNSRIDVCIRTLSYESLTMDSKSAKLEHIKYISLKLCP